MPAAFIAKPHFPVILLDGEAGLPARHDVAAGIGDGWTAVRVEHGHGGDGGVELRRDGIQRRRLSPPQIDGDNILDGTTAVS